VLRPVIRIAALLCLPALLLAQPDFAPDRKITYKQVPGDDLTLHVFQPADWKPTDHRPAIVFFFGGGWTGGNPQQFFPHARYFALRGMVAISAQYRTKGSHGVDPFACMADGRSAVAWVRSHASELGIDPGKVAAGGGSAGGHVAASTAFINVSPAQAPVALMLFNPVIDTTEKGYGAEKLGARQLDASPVHHVRPGAPPTIIFNGTADTTVPFENVERFQRLMQQAGNRVDLIPYDGRNHGFFNRSRSLDDYVDNLQHADRFLTSLGLLQ